MTHPVLGLDHTYLLVRDLDASAGLYRRLGFTLSPRGLHSPQKGTANHTIVFNDDYLELLGVVSETALNAAQRQSLDSDGEGLAAIANRTENADAAKPALAALGIATGDVSAFSRPLPLTDGGQGIASFRTLTFNAEAVPLGHFFLCQHETRDMVWRPELQQHANGAVALGGLVGISETPRETAENYARFYAAGEVHPSEGGFRVTTGSNSAPLLFLNRAAAGLLFPGIDIDATPANGFAAMRIRVGDIARTRDLLLNHGVSFETTPRGGLAVQPRDASGTVIEFLTETA